MRMLVGGLLTRSEQALILGNAEPQIDKGPQQVWQRNDACSLSLSAKLAWHIRFWDFPVPQDLGFEPRDDASDVALRAFPCRASGVLVPPDWVWGLGWRAKQVSGTPLASFTCIAAQGITEH